MCVGVEFIQPRESDRGGSILAVECDYGSTTTSQLLKLGYTARQIQSSCNRGLLTRLHRGVYAVGRSGGSFAQRCFAAALAVGADAAVSHMAAASLQGFWKRSPVNTVSITCGHRSVVPGIDVHERGDWIPCADIIRRGGMPFTTAAALTIDLGAVLSPFQLTNVVKEAAFQGAFDPVAFEREAERFRGRTGISVARRAVASYISGNAGTRSALEDRLIRLIETLRLPLPDAAGVPIGPHEVDLLWSERRLIIEVDGPGHRQPNSRRKDPARDADLSEAGFKVVRFTNYRIDGDPFTVAHDLARLLS